MFDLKQLVYDFEGGGPKNGELRHFINYLLFSGGGLNHTYIPVHSSHDAALDKKHNIAGKPEEVCRVLVEFGIDANLEAKRLCRQWPLFNIQNRARQILNDFHAEKLPTLVSLVKPVHIHLRYDKDVKEAIEFDTEMALQSGTFFTSYLGPLLAITRVKDPTIESVQLDGMVNARVPNGEPGASPQNISIVAFTREDEESEYESIESSQDDHSDPMGEEEGVKLEEGATGGSKEFFVTKTHPDPPRPSAHPPLSLSKLAKMVKTNVPIYWSNNSCYLDTQMVALLFDRSSPYFDYFSREIWEFFELIGQVQKLYLDAPAPPARKFTLMNQTIVDKINAHARVKIRRGEAGSTGGLEEFVTKGKLKAYYLSRDVSRRDPHKLLCLEGPFAILQLEPEARPLAESIQEYVAEYKGQKKVYRIHAICGLSDGHWQTLIHFQNQYYLVNVSMEVSTTPITLAAFLKRFTQFRIYYVCDDPRQIRTTAQVQSCEEDFKQTIVDFIKDTLGNPDASDTDPVVKAMYGWLQIFGAEFTQLLDSPLAMVWKIVHKQIRMRRAGLAAQIDEYLHQYAGGTTILDSTGARQY